MRTNEIYEYLKKNHTGIENAVFSKELEQRFSLSDRSLRRVISALRKEGCPICSGCKGYYFGKSKKDAGKTAAWLNDMADGIADSGKAMELSAQKPEEIKIIIYVEGMENMEDLEELFGSKSELADRLIRFFEENDTHAQERAKEEKSREVAMQETMRMLDSGLLMKALLEVLDRVQKEECNFLKKSNYLKLHDDLQDFYNRQASINAYEEVRRRAQRNHLCR
jgi:transcription initiation factor IIE alpha subunit